MSIICRKPKAFGRKRMIDVAVMSQDGRIVTDRHSNLPPLSNLARTHDSPHAQHLRDDMRPS
jgi:hypothetical protein